MNSNSSYINKITVWPENGESGENEETQSNMDNDIQDIVLGHLSESHYVPLEFLGEGQEMEPIWYGNIKRDYPRWAERVIVKTFTRLARRMNPTKRQQRQ
jgi:hypothetical protein